MFVSRKRLEALQKSYHKLADENMTLKMELVNNKYPSAENVIKKIIDRGIEWYDYDELERNLRRDYVEKIREIVENKAYQNEINRAISDLMKEIALSSKDFENVMALRMTINGMQILRERMEAIIEETKV